MRHEFIPLPSFYPLCVLDGIELAMTSVDPNVIEQDNAPPHILQKY